MQRPRTTFRTCWRITKTIARSARSSALVCAAAFALSAQIPAPSPAPASAAPSLLVTILRAHRAALGRMGVVEPKTLETTGSLVGLGLQGTFHSWHTAGKDRFDQDLGARQDSSVRIGDREYIRNASGNVRELTGTLLQRQRTQDFIQSSDFVDRPQYSTLLGRAKLPDGRAVVQIRVHPPGGDAEMVSIDGTSQMVDQIAYVDGDGTETLTYDDYRAVHGALVAFSEVDSNGDHEYDMTQRVLDVQVNKPIAPGTFAAPVGTTVQTEKPVTVKLTFRNGHVFAPVTIRGKHFEFLVDTGAQAVVVDSSAAASLILLPEGLLEVRGARRVGGVGIAALDSIDVGGVTLPVRVVSIVNLTSSTDGTLDVGGILGYPFFASAEVRLDLDNMTMTFGKPGSLPPLGEKLTLDTDRQLPEVEAKIDGVSTKMLLDTGNSTEMLVFHPFLAAHPGMIPYVGLSSVRNYGVGGSSDAVGTMVNELDIGSYRMFNRYANLMLSSRGAFADQVDGGNIGLATLKNFVVTFDLANRALYLQRGASFDDGRDRSG